MIHMGMVHTNQPSGRAAGRDEIRSWLGDALPRKQRSWGCRITQVQIASLETWGLKAIF